MHKVGTDYPTIKDIFDNYNESIKTLIKTSRKNNFNPERNNDYPSKKKTIIPRQRVKTSLHWKISPRRRTAFPVAANFAKKRVTLCVAARHTLVPRLDKLGAEN